MEVVVGVVAQGPFVIINVALGLDGAGSGWYSRTNGGGATSCCRCAVVDR